VSAVPPAAAVVAIRTDGHHVNQVQVRCVYCRSVHSHEWFDEPEGLRSPPCGTPGAMYRIRVGPREKVDAMRSEYPAPDNTIGLIPLRIRYAFEIDGGDDIVGVVMSTALGEFAIWLPAENAVQLAGQLVDIVENRQMLRERYIERAETSRQIAAEPANAAGPM
jgi:hypothetical protein